MITTEDPFDSPAAAGSLRAGFEDAEATESSVSSYLCGEYSLAQIGERVAGAEHGGAQQNEIFHQESTVAGKRGEAAERLVPNRRMWQRKHEAQGGEERSDGEHSAHQANLGGDRTQRQ